MTFNIWWLAYPLLGAMVGFFAGLLGVGGGGIMVPMLTTLFLAQGFVHEQVVHLALGTSMAQPLTIHHCQVTRPPSLSIAATKPAWSARICWS